MIGKYGFFLILEIVQRDCDSIFHISQVLLRRSAKPEGKYLLVSGSTFDQDLFSITWGPTVAALSSVYDNCLEKSVVQKAINGFRFVFFLLLKFPLLLQCASHACDLRIA